MNPRKPDEPDVRVFPAAELVERLARMRHVAVDAVEFAHSAHMNKLIEDQGVLDLLYDVVPRLLTTRDAPGDAWIAEHGDTLREMQRRMEVFATSTGHADRPANDEAATTRDGAE